MKYSLGRKHSTRPNCLYYKMSCNKILKHNGCSCQLKSGKAPITLNVHSNRLPLLDTVHISGENNVTSKQWSLFAIWETDRSRGKILSQASTATSCNERKIVTAKNLKNIITFGLFWFYTLYIYFTFLEYNKQKLKELD